MLDSKQPFPALERDGSGKLYKSEGNLLKAMAWAGICVSYDEFSLEYQIHGLPDYGPRLDDDALDELYLLIDREYFLKLPVQDFTRIVRAAARRNKFHPVRDYLAKLQWDGLDRIDRWLVDFAGAPDTPFVRAVSRLVLIAAVRRIRQPGCKFDEMLVLESPEGYEKSTAFRVLAGDDCFLDQAPLHADPRVVIEQLRGRWIVECADLAGMRRGEVETVKAFMSRTEDSATMKYARETTKLRRQCIFVGTTNESNYLLSHTGNRRFWPVRVGRFNIDGLRASRDQLWAEAALAEDSGEGIRLPRALWGDAADEQSARLAIDEWDDLVEDWLRLQLDERNLISPMGPRVTLAKVAEGGLGLKPNQLDQRTIERVAKCMRNAGWYRIRSNGKRVWQPVVETGGEGN